MTLPDFLTISRLSRHIPTSSGRGLSHQRASWMFAHIDDGDNRARVEAAVKAACEALQQEIENFLKSKIMFKVGDKVKLDEFGLKQWPNDGTFDVLEVVGSDDYGSGFGLITTLFPNTYIDADYFIPA